VKGDGLWSKILTEWAVKSEYLKMLFGRIADQERRYCQLNKGGLILQLLIFLKEGISKWKLKNQLGERWERIECKASWKNDTGKCSLRMNQSVMYGNYLMVETFNWKIEGNKPGKKETANRGGCTTLKKVYLIARKNTTGVKLRSYKRWVRSDGMVRGI
jgi:hypothetical protein